MRCIPITMTIAQTTDTKNIQQQTSSSTGISDLRAPNWFANIMEFHKY